MVGGRIGSGQLRQAVRQNTGFCSTRTPSPQGRQDNTGLKLYDNERGILYEDNAQGYLKYVTRCQQVPEKLASIQNN